MLASIPIYSGTILFFTILNWFYDHAEKLLPNNTADNPILNNYLFIHQ